MCWSISDEVHDTEQHPSSETTKAYLIYLKATDTSYCALLSALAVIIQAVAEVNTIYMYACIQLKGRNSAQA